MFQMSNHSKLRAAQRRLTPDELEYVRQFGKRYFCEGARVYYLREKDLPPGDRRRQWKNLVGTAVVMTLDMQVVITTWRNRKSGLKFIRRRGQQSRGRQGPSPWERDPVVVEAPYEAIDLEAVMAAMLEEEGADEVARSNFSE
jgi:hypothetical protein